MYVSVKGKQDVLNAEIEEMESVYCRFLCVRKSHGFTYMQGKAEFGLRALMSASSTLEAMGVPEFAKSLNFGQAVCYATLIAESKRKKIDDSAMKTYLTMCEYFYFTIRDMQRLAKGNEIFL